MKVLGGRASRWLWLPLLAAGTPAWSAESEGDAPAATPPAGVKDEAAAAAAEPAASADSAPVVPAGKPSGAGEDRKIEKEIQAAFTKDPDLKNNRIVVTVDNCNTDAYSTNCYVTLAGAVDNQAERMKAEQVARVRGVVIIDNLLDLGEEAEEGIADGAVTTRLREQLLTDAIFKNAIISISTTNGVVRLVGTVPSEAARWRAGEKARQCRAVKRVENALRVERPWQPTWRKGAVSQAPGVATGDRP